MLHREKFVNFRVLCFARYRKMGKHWHPGATLAHYDSTAYLHCDKRQFKGILRIYFRKSLKMPRNYNRGNGRREYVTYALNVLEEAVNSVLVYGMFQKIAKNRIKKALGFLMRKFFFPVFILRNHRIHRKRLKTLQDSCISKMTINNSIFI